MIPKPYAPDSHEAAEVILESPDNFGGTDSAIVRWARGQVCEALEPDWSEENIEEQ